MTTDKAESMHLPVLADGVEGYVQQVNSLPALSADEEKHLALRLRLHNDLAAAQKLILSHLRFVVHVARRYTGYGLPMSDLIQEGNIGLMKAVKRYDPDRGVRLASFAVHWIRAQIQEYIVRNWRLVKVATTKAQRKLFFNLRSSKKNLRWLNQEETREIAERLNVKPETVTEMEGRMSGQEVSFDPEPDHDDNDAVALTPSEYLQDENANAVAQIERIDWEEQVHSQLPVALEKLDPRSRDILERRWLAEDKATLQELAAEYGVSAERIRQLEGSALKKLKTHMAKFVHIETGESVAA